jgi:regulator of cell morphogenesis and NO signaling
MPDNNVFFPQVMQRYALSPSLAIGTFFQAQPPLSEIDKEFVATLLHSFEESNFSAADYEPYSIEVIVDYIQRTHAFYLQKKLPEIEQSISLLSGLYSSNHPILAALHGFFHKYCKDLTEHIGEEEQKLLPYIVLLRQAIDSPKHFSEYIFTSRNYSIARFLADHHETDDDLKDIRQTIRLYDPPATNESLYRILLAQLQAFEQDLQIHGCIEEQVLIPKTLKIETELNSRLAMSVPKN